MSVFLKVAPLHWWMQGNYCVSLNTLKTEIKVSVGTVGTEWNNNKVRKKAADFNQDGCRDVGWLDNGVDVQVCINDGRGGNDAVGEADWPEETQMADEADGCQVGRGFKEGWRHCGRVWLLCCWKQALLLTTLADSCKCFRGRTQNGLQSMCLVTTCTIKS